MNQEESGLEPQYYDNRKFNVEAFGNTVDEIELYALDEAREFFGDDVPLRVMRNYEVITYPRNSALADEANGKTYCARVQVSVRQ